MKSKVIILVGPPLSGKDTYLNNHLFEDFKIISRDDILMNLSEVNDYSEAFRLVNQKKVDRIFKDTILDSTRRKESVIINMTNLTKKTRKKHLLKFDSSDYEKIAIVFPKLTIEEYSSRNNKRNQEENKFIPLSVITTMIERWEDTSEDEGFDQIIKL